MRSPQTRRSFLKLAGAALGAAALPLQAADSGRLIGSQLYGWGQYYDRMGKKLGEHMDEVLSALRDAGYDYAEGSLDVFHPENGAKFAEQLRSKGLKPVCLYSGGGLHDASKAEKNVEGMIAAAKVAKAAGFSIINCNPDPIGREKTDAELAVQQHSLDLLGKGLNAIGMKLAVHNHTPEMVNKAREFHANFQKTDKSAVGFCYDVHWVFRGGMQPDEALKLYGDRVVSWHLRQSREGIWWEDVDTGDIDYSAVARHAAAHHLPPVYSVELALEQGTKITRDVVQNHARSIEFVKRVFA